MRTYASVFLLATGFLLSACSSQRMQLSKVEQFLSAASRGRCYAVIIQGIRRTICGK